MADNELTQQQLIALAKQGDANAIESIYNSYKSLVRTLVNSFYIVGGDKDDLLQVGMLGLINAINSYDESKGAFPPYVKVCVVNRVLQTIRNSNEDKNKPLNNYVELSQLEHIAESAYSPLDLLIEKELAEKINTQMNKLLTRYEKQVLQMFLQGFSYDDICKQLNKSYKSVDGAMQRARAKMSCIREQLSV